MQTWTERHLAGGRSASKCTGCLGVIPVVNVPLRAFCPRREGSGATEEEGTRPGVATRRAPLGPRLTRPLNPTVFMHVRVRAKPASVSARLAPRSVAYRCELMRFPVRCSRLLWRTPVCTESWKVLSIVGDQFNCSICCQNVINCGVRRGSYLGLYDLIP